MRSEKEPGKRSNPDPEPEVTPEIVAEAAVWIARLHGPDRSKRMERECRAWQARSAAHRLAFERGTDLWMDAAGVDRAAVERAAAAHAEAARDAASDVAPTPTMLDLPTLPRAGCLRTRPWAIALTTVVLAGVLMFEPWRDGAVYDTGVGEQRLVMLQDGTRMTLNTATRVRVALGDTRRTVNVEGGEALFEVAKDPTRPFIVRAAGSEVQATGTAFVVRYTPAREGHPDALDITLAEGRVVVRGVAGGETTADFVPAVEMVPGERLRVRGRTGHRPVVEKIGPPLDPPRMDQVLAWKRGEVVFDDVSLAEAVVEMNRYSAVPIVLAGSEAPGVLRVSGLFRAGDSAGFAHAVAKLHGLQVRERRDRLELLPG